MCQNNCCQQSKIRRKTVTKRRLFRYYILGVLTPPGLWMVKEILESVIG
jgi:hypothetical protein